MDFSFSSSKLEREAKHRREMAALKKTKEAKLAQQQAERDAEYETSRLQRREAQEIQRIAAEEAAAAEVALTGGITFSLSGLRPYRLEGSEDDKIILPESCLVDLNQVDAFSKGPVLLRIWSTNSTITANSNLTNVNDSTVAIDTFTHCGIREFSAPNGYVGLPDKVIISLLARIRCNTHKQSKTNAVDTNAVKVDEDGVLDCIGTINIKYVQLPKVTYAQLQPKKSTFSHVGQVKQCLEENLRQHSTLTVGDVVTIWYRGKSYELCVRKMNPATSGTLLDTDVEVDLDVSSEREALAATAEKSEPATSNLAKLATDTSLPALPTPPGTAHRLCGGNSALSENSRANETAEKTKTEKELVRERRLAAMAARGL